MRRPLPLLLVSLLLILPLLLPAAVQATSRTGSLQTRAVVQPLRADSPIHVSAATLRRAAFLVTQADLRGGNQLILAAVKTSALEDLLAAGATPAQAKKILAKADASITAQPRASVRRGGPLGLDSSFLAPVRPAIEWVDKYYSKVDNFVMVTPFAPAWVLARDTGLHRRWLDWAEGKSSDLLGVYLGTDTSTPASVPAAVSNALGEGWDKAQRDSKFAQCWNSCVGKDTGSDILASLPVLVSKDPVLASQGKILALQNQGPTEGQLTSMENTLFGDINTQIKNRTADLAAYDKTQPDLLAYPTATTSAQKAAVAQAQDKVTQEELRKYRAGVGLLTAIVAKFDPEGAKELGTVAGASIDIASTFSTWSAATANIGDLTGQIFNMDTLVACSNVYSAVAKCISIFGNASGGSPEAQIMQQIQQLQQQITQLHKDMTSRFDRVDKELERSYNDMMNEFAKVDQNFGQVASQVYGAEVDILQLRSDLDRFEGNMFDWVGALANESIAKDIDQGLGYQKHYGHPMSQPEFEQFESDFYVWATETAFDTAGHTAPLNGPYDDGTALTQLQNTPLEANLNYLEMLVRSRWPGSHLIDESALWDRNGAAHLPNPRWWAAAARAYSRLESEWPQWAKSIERNRAARIASIGTALQHGLRQIAVEKTTDKTPLLDKFFEDYRGKVENLKKLLDAEETKYQYDLKYYKLNRLGGVDQFPFLNKGAEGTVAGYFQTQIPMAVGSGSSGTTLLVPWTQDQVADTPPAFKLCALLNGSAHVDCCWNVSDLGRLPDPRKTADKLVIRVMYRLDGTVVAQRSITEEAHTDVIHAIDWVVSNWDRVRPYLENTPDTPDPAGLSFAEQNARWLLNREQYQMFSDVAADLKDEASMAANADLRNAVTEVQGSKALLASILQLGLPNALQQDDLLQTLLYGTEQIPGDALRQDLYAKYEAASSGSLSVTPVSPIPGFTTDTKYRVDYLQSRVSHYQQLINAGKWDETMPLLATTAARAHLMALGAKSGPAFRSLTPARGKVGATVTITGARFGAKRGTAKVYFGSKAATRYVSWSATKIKVKVPKISKGRKAVKVKTSGGVSNVKYFKRI